MVSKSTLKYSCLKNLFEEKKYKEHQERYQSDQFRFKGYKNLVKSVLQIDSNIEESVELKIQCHVKCKTTSETILSRTLDYVLNKTRKTYKASEKIALLFGVSEYHFSQHLKPVEDILKKLERCLEKYSFKTFSFLNLSPREMRQVIEFVKSLVKANTYCMIFKFFFNLFLIK